MTVVAGLVDPITNSVILVADSRVSTPSGSKQLDICQKVAQLDNQGLFGFAGPIKEAGSIANWITGTYKKRGVGWLNSRSEVIGFLSHVGVLGQQPPNAFLVAFMGNARATLVRFSTDGDYARTTSGIEMIGSGSETYQAIRPQFTAILRFGGPGRAGIAIGQRALFLSEMVVDEARARSIDSVGGLMQVHFVEKGGVRALPYERWVDVDESHGTYVSMDIDASGAWVQVHEPSGLKVPLRFPSEPDFGCTGTETGTNFELERLLSKNSPGVQPTPIPVEVYRLSSTDAGDWLVRTPTGH